VYPSEPPPNAGLRHNRGLDKGETQVRPRPLESSRSHHSAHHRSPSIHVNTAQAAIHAPGTEHPRSLVQRGTVGGVRQAYGIAVGALAYGALWLAGCTECTDTVCTSSFSFRVVEATGEPLRDGTWMISISSPGHQEVGLCEVGGEDAPVECDSVEFDARFRGSDQRGEFIFAYNDAEDTPDIPDSIVVQIDIDGERVLDVQQRVIYERLDPGCDDACRGASLSLELP